MTGRKMKKSSSIFIRWSSYVCKCLKRKNQNLLTVNVILWPPYVYEPQGIFHFQRRRRRIREEKHPKSIYSRQINCTQRSQTHTHTLKMARGISLPIEQSVTDLYGPCPKAIPFFSFLKYKNTRRKGNIQIYSIHAKGNK